MLSDHIKAQIYGNFGFEPTFGQKKVIENLADYISSGDTETIFMINGYAGTGKTLLIAALVKTLSDLKIRSILMAPTGRAAKVMSRYAGQKAYTIHKQIYRQKSLSSSEIEFSLDVNKMSDAVFIVDEASMLANSTGETSIFGSGNLLDDLVKYVRSGKRCRLIIVGDSAQLPPVGLDESPALDPRRMEVYGPVRDYLLDEVVRQEYESGILFNATLVRCMLEAGITDIPLFDTSFPDVESLEGGDILESIQDAYDRYGMEETIVITRSNKRANRFNEAIRRNVRFAEEEIESGDMLMVVKNNYYYAEKLNEEENGSGIDFIANGDTARLARIRRFEELYGFRFAETDLAFPDYDDFTLRCKILLDTLASDSPSLTREQGSRFFFSVAEDYAEIPSKAKRYKEVRENPYFNAMQVKFAYAITCHKSQGGQWKCVFIDKMLFGEEEISRDLLRWLYTAITRATVKLYFINFEERFFENK